MRYWGISPRWSGFSSSSRLRRNIDGHAASAWRDHGRGGSEGHQERPSERLSASRPSQNLRPITHERGHDPRICDFQNWMDQATAGETSKPGTRAAARVSRPRKPLRVGEAVPAEAGREQQPAGDCTETQMDGDERAPGDGRHEEARDPGGLVSRTDQAGYPTTASPMGAGARGEG